MGMSVVTLTFLVLWMLASFITGWIGYRVLFPVADQSQSTQVKLEQVVMDQTEPPIIEAQEQSYLVQSGDSLSKVAVAKYGCEAAVAPIAELNNISVTDWLYVGQSISLPDSNDFSDSLKKLCHQSTQTETKQDQASTYQVMPGDSLWHIAEQQLGDPFLWFSIYESNRDVLGPDPDVIFPSTVLELPVESAASEQLMSYRYSSPQ